MLWIFRLYPKQIPGSFIIVNRVQVQVNILIVVLIANRYNIQ